MSKGFGNLMRQAQQMQKKMAAAQEDLGKEIVVGEAGQGQVKVKMTGAYKLASVTIAPELIDPADPETMQDLIALAVNDGVEKVRVMKDEAMKKVTGGLGVPGMF
jgi:DNA-binding YbaB/EbfC family protein